MDLPFYSTDLHKKHIRSNNIYIETVTLFYGLADFFLLTGIKKLSLLTLLFKCSKIK